MWSTGFGRRVVAIKLESMRYCGHIAMSISSNSKKVRGYSLVRLDLPAGLKRRIAVIARDAGKTPHALMLEAIESKARLALNRKRSSG